LDDKTLDKAKLKFPKYPEGKNLIVNILAYDLRYLEDE
jgi:hypothetical protein